MAFYVDRNRIRACFGSFKGVSRAQRMETNGKHNIDKLDCAKELY